MRPEPPPLAVVAKIQGALRLTAIDVQSERRGLQVGMGLADARGAYPDLRVEEADEDADRALLEGVADWCDRYTPLVALDPPYGLFLDITGCAHLFAASDAEGEGESALLADCLRRLARHGFEAEGAVASTAGAAWALAHAGPGGCVPAGSELAALAPLPVQALRINSQQEVLLDRLGLKCIGQLIDMPRAPLTARFGPDLVRRLDQALAAEDEALSPRRPPPCLSAERKFAEPVTDRPSLLQTIRSLAAALEPALERQGIGARLFELAFFRVDGRVIRIPLGAANPLRKPAVVAMLFSERLTALEEEWDAGFGFDLVRLAVLQAERFDAVQGHFSGETSGGPDLAGLVDRLGARLGPSRIRRFVPVDTHIPERAVVSQPLAASAGLAAVWVPLEAEQETPSERPLRLFARAEPVEVMAEVPEGPPLRFRWRRVVHEVMRAEGPERIASEWWLADSSQGLTRDYYRIEDAEGRRYWLYREGLYDREAARPAWYLHGLFA